MKTCTKNINGIFELVAIEMSTVKDADKMKKSLEAKMKAHAKTCKPCSAVLDGFYKRLPEDYLGVPQKTCFESETRVPLGKIGDSEAVCVMGEEENRYPVPRNLTYPVNH